MSKVLIIDDDTTVLRNVGEMLHLEGHEVRIAEDGADGVQIAAAMLPDLVICDVVMPGVDGVSVLEALRKGPTTQSIPFIMISGFRDQIVVDHIFAAGANACLAKPFTRDALLKVVASVL